MLLRLHVQFAPVTCRRLEHIIFSFKKEKKISKKITQFFIIEIILDFQVTLLNVFILHAFVILWLKIPKLRPKISCSFYFPMAFVTLG